MAKQSKSKRGTPAVRSGGVNISGRARVDVKGDVVGRDKTEGISGMGQLETLFSQLAGSIRSASGVAPDEQQHLTTMSKELEAELREPQPDLGKVERLKNALSSRGGQIASAAAAIFSYGPVQDTLRTATQRLLGG